MKKEHLLDVIVRISIKNKLNLSLLIFPRNPGWRGRGLLSWKSRKEGGGGLVLQETQVRGEVTKMTPSVRGVWIFSGITQSMLI